MESKIVKALTLLWLVLSNPLNAQTNDMLWQLYQEKNIGQLQSHLNKMDQKQLDDPEVRFFKAILLEDGDNARQQYEDLFRDATGILRKYTAKKLTEYYYAKGYYVKAAGYDKHYNQPVAEPRAPLQVKKTSPNAVSSIKETNLVIQVGAFKFEDNANKLKQVLLDDNVPASVVTRPVAGRNLYCVWVTGKPTFAKTDAFAKTIKDKYRLQYRIIEK